MKTRLIFLSIAAAAAWLVACPAARAQNVLASNQSDQISLTNAAVYVGLTNCPSSIGTPLLTTIANLGPGPLDYTWDSTNGVWHYLPAGGLVSFGPATMLDATIYLRLFSTTNTTARTRRDLRRR